MDRRAFTTFFMASMVFAPARAAEIVDDRGRKLETFQIPIEVQEKLQTAPGLMRAGAASPTVRLTEFFDFNCPFCKKAAPEIEDLLRANDDVQLVLLHNPILSPASRDAAKVALAVWTLLGQAESYRFSLALLSKRGAIDGARALAEAAALGMAQEALRARAADPRIDVALQIHERLAGESGFSGTPAFEIKGQGFNGYPGAEAITNMIASVRRCDELAC